MATKKYYTNKVKENREFIENQKKFFTNPSDLIRDLLNISKKYPLPSLIFVSVFGILTNGIYSIIALLLPSSNEMRKDTWVLVLINVVLLTILTVIFLVIKWKYKNLYRNIPISQKKVLVTNASIHTEGYLKTASWSFFQAMLYRSDKIAKKNQLEKVCIISTEDKRVSNIAQELKDAIKKQGRSAQILRVKISGTKHTVDDIKDQINKHFTQSILKNNKNYEVITDYTGGTKELGVALYLVCLDHFVLPAYLDLKKTSNTGQVEK